MLNKKQSARTKAEKRTNADVSFVSQPIANTTVVRCILSIFKYSIDDDDFPNRWWHLITITDVVAVISLVTSIVAFVLSFFYCH